MLSTPGKYVVLVFLGVLGVCWSIYVVEDECPPNEEYLLCGSGCPQNCSNLDDPSFCSQQCVEGCFCTLGLVRDENGTCVPPDQCNQGNQKQCPKDEEYLTCGPACPVNCTNLGSSEVCVQKCAEGCFCTAGLVRDENSSCVKPDQCGKKTPSCGQNEEYKTCGTACAATCSQPDPEACDQVCKSGCVCKDPYVRDESSGKCVAVDDCPPESCFTENEVYDTCNAGCEPSCADPEPICSKVCKGGCICNPGLFRNSYGDCVSVEKCTTTVNGTAGANGTDATDGGLKKYLDVIHKLLNV